MQSRAAAIGEGEVVDVALALQPHRPELGVVAVGLGVFGEAEAKLGVEIIARLHVGREAVEMVDSLDARALIGGVLLQHALALIHFEVEFERHAEGIAGAQRTPLMGGVAERGGQTFGAEPMGRSVEIVLARHLEAERAAARLRRLAQHDGVVIALLHGPQMQRVR